MPTTKRTQPPIMQKLGARVRELREQAGLSQADLERASGISRVFLGVVERAEKGVGVEAVGKIAEGLNVEPVELVRFREKDSDITPEAKLGKKIASLAKGASAAKLDRFERIARVFFERDLDEKATRARSRATRR